MFALDAFMRLCTKVPLAIQLIGKTARIVKVSFQTPGLTSYNVSLTWDECWQYYRHYAPAGLIMAVIASMIVGETERGNDMFMAMAKRSARMSRELDSLEVIGS